MELCCLLPLLALLLRFTSQAAGVTAVKPVANVKGGKESPGCTHLVSNPGKSPIKKTSVCSDMGLSGVPKSIARGVVSELNLNGNQIRSLHEDAFTTWADVEVLSIEVNEISIITEKAFRPLKKLRKLSLKNNKLVLGTSITRSALRYISSLEELDLSLNPLGTIPNNFFRYLKSLKILHLNDALNGLKVKEYSFVGLPRLETLDLTNNFIRQLPEKGLKESLNNMSLINLYLGGENQWICDCHLRWLKVWHVQHKRNKVNYIKTVIVKDAKGDGRPEKIEPICKSPPLVKNKSFFGNDIQIIDFQCKPLVHTKPFKMRLHPGVNVTLDCRIFCDPKGLVDWYKDGTLVQPHWDRISMKKSQGTTFRAKLHIHNLKKADAGEWVCETTNRRGKAATNFTIEVVDLTHEGVLMTRVVLYGGIAAAGLIVFLIIVGIVIYCIYYRRDQAASRAYKSAAQRAHAIHGGHGGRRDLVGDAIDGLLDSDPEYHSSGGGGLSGHNTGTGGILVSTTADGHHTLLDKDNSETMPLTSRLGKVGDGQGGVGGLPPPPYPAATATIRRVTATPGGPIVHNENCPVHGSRAMMAVAAAAAATYGPCPVHSSTSAIDGCVGGCGTASSANLLAPQSTNNPTATSRSQTPQLISNPVYGTLPSAATAAQLRAVTAAAAAATGGYKPCPLHGDMYATIQKQAAARTTPISNNRNYSTLPTRQSSHEAPTTTTASLVAPTTGSSNTSNASYVPAARVDDCITAATSFVGGGIDEDGEEDAEEDEDSLPPPPPPLTATSELSDDDLSSSTLRRHKSSTNASTSTGTASSSSSVMAAAPPLPPPPLPAYSTANGTATDSSNASSTALTAVTSTMTNVSPSVNNKPHQDDEGYSTAV